MSAFAPTDTLPPDADRLAPNPSAYSSYRCKTSSSTIERLVTSLPLSSTLTSSHLPLNPRDILARKCKEQQLFTGVFPMFLLVFFRMSDCTLLTLPTTLQTNHQPSFTLSRRVNCLLRTPPSHPGHCSRVSTLDTDCDMSVPSGLFCLCKKSYVCALKSLANSVLDMTEF